MAKRIYFDMDGTVYDLYGVNDWLNKLETADVTAYTLGKPLVNLKELEKVCKALIANGYEIGVITWLCKGGSEKFNNETTTAKREWVNKNMPYVTEFTAQTYGTPKQKAVGRNVKFAVLVDDNDEVREMWNTPKQRKSIDAKLDIITKLWELV